MFGLFGKKQPDPPVQKRREISPVEEAFRNWELNYRSNGYAPFDESFLLHIRGAASGNGGLVRFFHEVSKRLDAKYHIPLEALFEFEDKAHFQWRQRRGLEQEMGLEDVQVAKAHYDAERWIPDILKGVLTFVAVERADDPGVDKAEAAHIATLVARFCLKHSRYQSAGKDIALGVVRNFRQFGTSGEVRRQEVVQSTLFEADLIALCAAAYGQFDCLGKKINLLNEHDRFIGPPPIDRYQRFLYNGPSYVKYVAHNAILPWVETSDLRKVNQLAVSWWNENPDFPGNSDLVESILANPGLFCGEAIATANRLIKGPRS